jgi:hypothetical protein
VTPGIAVAALEGERAWEIARAMRALVTERTRAGTAVADDVMGDAVREATRIIGDDPADIACAVAHLATLVFHAVAYGVIASNGDASEVERRLQQQYLVWPDGYGSVLA